ncbi:MAG: hypothetical protein V3W34_01375 [Phycisphaerae bacterium]
MTSQPLQAHSIAEAHFYLMVTPCPRCGRGPLKSEGPDREEQSQHGLDREELDRESFLGPDGRSAHERSAGPGIEPESRHSCRALCRSCGHQDTFTFTLPQTAPDDDPNNLYPIVNPSDEPSKILDVGQWITLFRVILESAGNQADKIEARRLGYEAAQCLEEAIKFYDDDELPPEEAVFCETTRAHLRDHPQQFARQRLIELRAKLPQAIAMQRRITRDAQKRRDRHRPWWKFWA